MKKRIISLLLCLVMVVGLLPVTAYADIAQENMNTYAGKRITKIELKASVNTDIYPTTNTDSYAVSREITVGDPVENTEGKNTAKRIKFEITSMTWKQGKTGALQQMSGTEAETILRITVNGLRWMTGAVSYWEWVNSDDHYLACKYNYMISVDVNKSKLGGADTEQGNYGYRIDPNVVVTVDWYGSGRAAESCSVNVYNSHDVKYGLISSSINATTADFTISGDGALKLKPAGVSIPAGFGSEAIKPISLALWASGGTKPYTFSKVSGPDWINVSTEGKITGTPPAAGAATDTLKVMVTDATSATTATADISVGAMKEARTVIKRIEIAGLDYPRVGDVIPHVPNVYITKIVAADGSVISQGACPLYLNRPQWEDQNGNIVYNTGRTFAVGEKYQFSVQVRLEGADNCEKYYLDKDFTAIVPRFVGGGEDNNKLKVNSASYLSGENYACLFVDSPMWAAVDTGHTLTGDVTYSGAARYGQKLTANVTLSGDAATGVNKETDLSYQWQRKHNNLDIWYDIDGATDKQLTLNDDDLIDRQIRVTVRCTGTNYAGTIFGAPITVGKNWNMGTPVRPVIEYDAANSKLTIKNDSWKGAEGTTNQQEYAWTTSATKDETTGYAVWPDVTDGDVVKGTGQNLSSVEPGKTYYVYTRIKESKTMEAGRILEAASFTVPTGEAGTSTDPVKDVSYPNYPFGQRTIYIPVGDNVEVEYKIDPDTATDNMPYWKSTNDSCVKIESQNDGVLKLKGIAATTTYVSVEAQKSSTNSQPWYYYGSGTVYPDLKLYVYVYDPADLTTIPRLEVDGSTIDLYVGDTYTFDFDGLRDENFLPTDVGSKEDYKLQAYIVDDYSSHGAWRYVSIDDILSVISSSDGAKDMIEALGVGSNRRVEILALATDESGTIIEEPSAKARVAVYTVNVKARPTLLDFSITPPVLTLRAGETYQLIVNKTLNDAAAADSTGITWESNNTAVTVTKDTSDSSKATVKVSATATAGTATITAKYGDGTTALTANCVITMLAACTDHTYVYQEKDWGHAKVCLFCGDEEKDSDDKVKIEYHDLYTVSENGQTYDKCSCCGYQTDPFTSDETINTPDSSSGGHHSGAGRPYRPGLSTAAPEGTTTAAVQSPKTGDAGIMLYAALSLMSMTGGAWLVSKKRRDR